MESPLYYFDTYQLICLTPVNLEKTLQLYILHLAIFWIQTFAVQLRIYE